MGTHKLTNFYDVVQNIEPKITKHNTSPIKFSVNFLDGPFCEILGDGTDSEYNVKFIDMDSNSVIYNVNLNSYNWAKVNIKYFSNWRVVIKKNNSNLDAIIYDMNLNGNRVFIKFESSSLGDSIAWIPYVEEFRKKHNCVVLCSTFHNDLFEKVYPDIKFIKPDEEPFNIYAKYRIGWFYNDVGNFDSNLHPRPFVDIPLQKTASDILGLEFLEIRPQLICNGEKKLPIDKYFTFSIQSTAQSKYWNNSTGWSDLIRSLREFGYYAVCVDYEKTFGNGEYMNTIPSECINATKMSINDTIDVMKYAKFHIGISSGLSWLAWAVGNPVVMISGFSNPILEFSENCIRIHNPNVCNGCFTNPIYKFDPSDWSWCPIHKGTDRQFECSKTITADSVISKMKQSMLI